MKKLALNKQIIANLDNSEKIYGGTMNTCTLCNTTFDTSPNGAKCIPETKECPGTDTV